MPGETTGAGQSTVPVAARKGVVQVAAGNDHSLVLKANGSVVVWGANYAGQTDLPVAARKGVVHITAGSIHSLAVKANGSVVAWGENSWGQATVPTVLTGVAQVAAGFGHSLALVAGDQQPDALVGTRASAGYRGDDVYNTTGTHQTRTVKARRTETRVFYVRVANDGSVTNTFRVTGSAARAGSKVRYFEGSTNISAAMRSRVGWPVTLGPDDRSTIKVETKILRTAKIGSRKPATVQATWAGTGNPDLVKGIVKVVR